MVDDEQTTFSKAGSLLKTSVARTWTKPCGVLCGARPREVGQRIFLKKVLGIVSCRPCSAKDKRRIDKNLGLYDFTYL